MGAGKIDNHTINLTNCLPFKLKHSRSIHRTMISLGNCVTISFLIYLMLNDVCCANDVINYLSNKNIINGLVFPREINAVVGEEIYLKIVEPVANQHECHYRKTGEKDVNVQSPHTPK